MSYIVRDRQAGNEIERFDNLIDALNEVKEYYFNDKRDGNFEPNFYEIYDTDNEEIIEVEDEKSTCYYRTYISRLIKDNRTALGWSVYELAKRSGVQAISIHNIENGKFDVKGETLIRLSTAMGKRLILD